jgi:hypothetical protein
MKRTGGVISVVAVRPDGEIAGTFDAMIDAERFCGVKTRGIRDCVHGRRKTCKGLMWYRNDEEFKHKYLTDRDSLKFELDPNRDICGRLRKGHKVKVGSHLSEEAKRAKSELMKRLRQNKDFIRKTAESHRKISVVEVETGRRWRSVKEAAEALGSSIGTINYHIHHGGKCRKNGCHYMTEELYNKTSII